MKTYTILEWLNAETGSEVDRLDLLDDDECKSHLVGLNNLDATRVFTAEVTVDGLTTVITIRE